MTVPLNIQGHVVDQVRTIAKIANVPHYDIEFEDRGGVHFLYFLLKDGTRIPQELRAGWPETLLATLKTMKEEESRVREVKEVPLTVAVLHKPTGQWTATDVLQKQVREYANAIVDSFKKRTPSTPTDFVLIEVDWTKKHLNITRLE